MRQPTDFRVGDKVRVIKTGEGGLITKMIHGSPNLLKVETTDRLYNGSSMQNPFLTHYDLELITPIGELDV